MHVQKSESSRKKTSVVNSGGEIKKRDEENGHTATGDCDEERCRRRSRRNRDSTQREPALTLDTKPDLARDERLHLSAPASTAAASPTGRFALAFSKQRRGTTGTK